MNETFPFPEDFSEAEKDMVKGSPFSREMLDHFVENHIGQFALPLGAAKGFLIDGEKWTLPLATEEPSVVAAASFGARMAAKGTGFQTAGGSPLVEAQIFLEGDFSRKKTLTQEEEGDLIQILHPLLARMEQRGGGFRGLTVEWLEKTGVLKVEVILDVRNAMGANLANSAAELLTPLLEKIFQARKLMAILTNRSEGRLTRAEFSTPVKAIPSRSGSTSREIAERIVKAAELAREDRGRGITHNKGIMNGISALVCATGNDTRAVEAAAHAWASRSGHYSPLTQYRLEGDQLTGIIELPLPVGVVGGITRTHPAARACLHYLGDPDSSQLSRMAASLGLAQNFAALRALVSEGIQQGHMRLHRRKEENS